jgi:ubiquinone/menaquinone biosynthesis C-methylase UbiE
MRALDIGGGQPHPHDSYSLGFVNTPDEPEWVSINVEKRANPTHVGCASNMSMFPPEPFDYVRALHFPAPQLNFEVLKEISRVLKPRGTVNITTGCGILDNPTFARDFITIFRATLISGYSDYFGVKRHQG